MLGNFTYSNPTKLYFGEDVDNKIIPVGCILTMVGTGSEMKGGAVITNHEAKLKMIILLITLWKDF